MEEQIYRSNQGEITINLKNIFLALWSRKVFITKVFTIVLALFIAMTFILEKKWTVNADLYINKANSTNYLEINPYALDEMGGMASLLASADPLADELELIQSPLVLDKVIKENDLKFKKLYGIIPTKKTGQYLTTEKFLKKGINFETKEGTRILSISYTNKDKDKAYNVVNSVITNYIELYKEINSKKSKSDKAILESEYKKAKAELNKQMNSANGLPPTSLGAGNLAALSAFSRSAQNAIANIKGQYVAGEKSRIAVSESAAKVSQLAQKLEWANLVDEMSDSSKVLVIKEPYPLRDWEYSSPKLLINILLGIVFGIIFSIIGVIYKEVTDKKLAYSMLGNDVIYDIEKEFNKLSAKLISNSENKTAFVKFEEFSGSLQEKFKSFANVVSVKADISNDFKTALKNIDNIVLFATINKTDSERYKIIKSMLEDMNKNIVYEVILN